VSEIFGRALTCTRKSIYVKLKSPLIISAVHSYGIAIFIAIIAVSCEWPAA